MADAPNDISWSRGQLSFQSQPLREIVRQLANTYQTDIRNATLRTLVSQLENATGYTFIYGDEVRLTRRIDLKRHRPIQLLFL